MFSAASTSESLGCSGPKILIQGGHCLVHSIWPQQEGSLCLGVAEALGPTLVPRIVQHKLAFSESSGAHALKATTP